MISLRRSALIWMALVLTILGAVAFVISYEVARGEASDFLDGQLRQIALNVGTGLDETATPPVRQDPEDEFVIAVWNAAGEQLRKPAHGIALPWQSSLGLATVNLGDDTWRIYVASDGHRTVQVAQRMSVRQEMAQAAGLQAGLAIVAAIPFAWLVIGWSIRQMTDRLTSLAPSIATRGVESRGPIPANGVPTEVLPLVEAMNGLIGRLQTTVEKQQRFVSDAAHELRTPLAALQIQADNLEPVTSCGRLQPLSELRDGIRRASAMVEQLLRMARLDEPLSR